MATSLAPRGGDGTLTVRVRTLLIGLALIAVVAGVAVFAYWGSSMQPLRLGSSSTGVHGLAPQPHTQDRFDQGPIVWKWAKGGGYIAAFQVLNTASVPVTITGAEFTGGREWQGLFTGPRLAIPNQSLDVADLGAFHPFTIPAGSDRELAFVWTTNPRVCQLPDHGSGGGDPQMNTQSTDSVQLRFTTLGRFHNSQYLESPDQSFWLSSPTAAACAG